MTHERASTEARPEDPSAANTITCFALAPRLRMRGQMIGSAKIYFLVYGALTIVGGLVGYLKAGSTISLISGGIAGALLIVAAFLLPSQFLAGIVLALLVSLVLAGRFVPNFFATGKVMPAGIMSLLSVIGIVVAVATWLKR
jgi:uncharacterized membrane protein (UPF0136 family)